jgi:hypothetical protein
MLPAWADILILCALPVIVLAAVWIWGEDDEPDNAVIHHQQDEPQQQEPDVLAEAA